MSDEVGLVENQPVSFGDTVYPKDKDGFYTTKKERLSYYSHSVGGFIFNTAFGATLIVPFFTDSGISAITISIILLITKIWDAINDPIGGAIIERANFKGGKYKPWLKFGTIALTIGLVLFFLLPTGWAEPLKVTYVLIFYLLIEGVFTFTDAPAFGISLACTNVVQERVKIYSTAGVFAGIGALLATGIFTLKDSLGWPYWVFGIIMAGLYLLFSIHLPWNAKERFVVRADKPIPVSTMIKSIFTNKYMVIYYVCLFITFGTSTIQGVLVYVARYVLGNSDAIMVLTVITLAPVFFVAFLIPKITKKIDKFKLFLIFNIGTVITSILTFIVGYKVPIVVFYILCFLRGTFFSGISLMAYTFTGDLIEYGHFVKGERAEGVAFSFQTFAAKGISALQTFLCTMLLGLFGFISGLDAAGQPVAQPDTTVKGIWYLFTLIPCVGGIIGIVLFYFLYHLKDKDVQIMSKANHSEITREEALSQLTREYK